MTIQQLGKSDEQVEDVVASLITGQDGANVTYDDANNTLTVGLTDVLTTINDLFIANAEQDFELGLTQLSFRDGQFQIYANDNKIVSNTGVNLRLGSPLNDRGFVKLLSDIGDVSVQQATFTNGDDTYRSLAVDGDDVYPAGKNLFDDSAVVELDKATLTEQQRFSGHTQIINDIDIGDLNGFTAGKDQVVRKWDLDTFTQQNTFTGHFTSVKSIEIEGANGFSGGAEIRKWDTDTLTQQAKFSGHGADIQAIDTDATEGYSGDENGVIKEWDLATLTEQGTFSDHTSQINGIIVDGTHGYSASSDNTVKKWDLDTLTLQDTFTGHTNNANCVVVDSVHGYSGGDDNIVRQWDLDTLTQVNQFTGHSSGINGIGVDKLFGYSSDQRGNVKKWGEGLETINGSVQHEQEDIGFTPQTAIISDDLRQLPTNTDVRYEISDDVGNSVSIQRSDIDSSVDVSALSSSIISTTVFIERPNTSTASPELDAWALYLDK